MSLGYCTCSFVVYIEWKKENRHIISNEPDEAVLF